MTITSSAQVTCVFSLCCVCCDGGSDIDTPEQAIAEGWSDIEEDFDGFSWNYLGTCPECREDDERTPAPPPESSPRKGAT